MASEKCITVLKVFGRPKLGSVGTDKNKRKALIEKRKKPKPFFRKEKEK